MLKKVILALIFIVIGVLIGKYFLGSSQIAVMPSPNNLYRAVSSQEDDK